MKAFELMEELRQVDPDSEVIIEDDKIIINGKVLE